MKQEILQGLGIGQCWSIHPSQQLIDIASKINTTLYEVIILEYLPFGYPDNLYTEYTLTVAHPSLDFLAKINQKKLSATNLVVAKSFDPHSLSERVRAHDISKLKLIQLLAHSSSQTSRDWAEILQNQNTIYYP